MCQTGLAVMAQPRINPLERTARSAHGMAPIEPFRAASAALINEPRG